jgi:hypothetical protein
MKEKKKSSVGYILAMKNIILDVKGSQLMREVPYPFILLEKIDRD